MKSKVLDDSGGERTIALVFSAGEDPVELMNAFVREHNVVAARFSAVGALSEATLGYFEVDRRDYARIAVAEQVEVLSLDGDVALDGGQPKIHAHVVLGRRDGSTSGGHLLAARVRPTLEVMMVQSPRYLARRYDPASGLSLIDLGA